MQRVSGSGPSTWPAPACAADAETERAIPSARPIARDHAHITLLTGPSAGEVSSLTKDETFIGRDDGVDIRVADPAVSRRHARILHLPEDDFILEDLGSTNGTYVGAEGITQHTLRSGDQIQVGPHVIFRFALTDDVEERLQRQLFESAIRDPLTGTHNRRYLDERLAAEVAHARRHQTKLALLMMDLDDFKATNDRHGHIAGDTVLRHVSDVVRSHIRVEDVFARFGGEEFVVVTRGDGVENAAQLAERLRSAVASTSVEFDGVRISVTISIGVAEIAEVPHPATPTRLLERADARLYRAKVEGRDRVVSSD
jgi:diguanylate cyclase (GGDEF)-like protein